MVRLWHSNVAMGERIAPDEIQLLLGTNEISGEPELVLALVAGKARVTYVTRDLDPGGVLRLVNGPGGELILKLGK